MLNTSWCPNFLWNCNKNWSGQIRWYISCVIDQCQYHMWSWSFLLWCYQVLVPFLPAFASLHFLLPFPVVVVLYYLLQIELLFSLIIIQVFYVLLPRLHDFLFFHNTLPSFIFKKSVVLFAFVYKSYFIWNHIALITTSLSVPSTFLLIKKKIFSNAVFLVLFFLFSSVLECHSLSKLNKH